jgi:hypothetical protein
MQSPSILVVTGPKSSGKTAVSEALHELVQQSHRPASGLWVDATPQHELSHCLRWGMATEQAGAVPSLWSAVAQWQTQARPLGPWLDVACAELVQTVNPQEEGITQDWVCLYPQQAEGLPPLNPSLNATGRHYLGYALPRLLAPYPFVVWEEPCDEEGRLLNAPLLALLPPEQLCLLWVGGPQHRWKDLEGVLQHWPHTKPVGGFLLNDSQGEPLPACFKEALQQPLGGFTQAKASMGWLGKLPYLPPNASPTLWAREYVPALAHCVQRLNWAFAPHLA